MGQFVCCRALTVLSHGTAILPTPARRALIALKHGTAVLSLFHIVLWLCWLAQLSSDMWLQSYWWPLFANHFVVVCAACLCQFTLTLTQPEPLSLSLDYCLWNTAVAIVHSSPIGEGTPIPPEGPSAPAGGTIFFLAPWIMSSISGYRTYHSIPPLLVLTTTLVAIWRIS